MSQTESCFTLVKGTFLPADAADVLFSLISDKIKFHQLQIRSLQKQSDADISWSEKRIASLKKAKDLSKDLILFARSEGYELKIDGDIRISLIKIEETTD